MKRIFALALLALTIAACDEEDMSLAQAADVEAKGVLNDKSQIVNSGEIFMVVEEQPTYPGGMSEWMKHLKSTLKYPDQAKREGIEGAVFLSFTVEKDGSLADIEVVRGIGAGCDEEAVEALLESPNWSPGKQKGEAVRTKMQVRIVFKLNSEIESEA